MHANEEKCPDFGIKGPDCVHLWLKFSIQNVVLRVKLCNVSLRASVSCACCAPALTHSSVRHSIFNVSHWSECFFVSITAQ